eukprot:4583003-Prymnesium_polylepis.1
MGCTSLVSDGLAAARQGWRPPDRAGRVWHGRVATTAEDRRGSRRGNTRRDRILQVGSTLIAA